MAYRLQEKKGGGGLTDREKQLIEAYIPSPRDTSLTEFEYYVEDMSGTIQRVEITDILPRIDKDTIYLVVQTNTRRRVKGCQEYDGFTMSYLYDNKKDCKDGTHNCFPYWERLREIQTKEGLE